MFWKYFQAPKSTEQLLLEFASPHSKIRKQPFCRYSLSLLYSRNCSICLSSNPRRRAVMITCGHFTCSLCAEQLGDENGQRPFPCPLCRQSTFYVKTFEEVDPLQMRQETLGTRKRKMNGDDDDDDGASSVKSPRIADPSCFMVNK